MIANVTERRSRLRGLVSGEFHRKTILDVGAGAGSCLVEKVARLDPGCLKICDFDRVETSNLVRTVYCLDDVGSLKVDALARRIQETGSTAQVVSYACDFTHATELELDEMFADVDLVIAGTDQFAAQARVNAEAVRRGIPSVTIGIHARGEGGRILWYVPEETGCYRCLAPERYRAAAEDVGNTRTASPVDLAGMVGSVIDGSFIDLVAAKIILALLERGQDTPAGRFYERMRGRNDVVVRCHPEYAWGSEMWGAVLADLPTTPRAYARELETEAFLAMDTLWLRGSRDPDCPVCNDKNL